MDEAGTIRACARCHNVMRAMLWTPQGGGGQRIPPCSLQPVGSAVQIHPGLSAEPLPGGRYAMDEPDDSSWGHARPTVRNVAYNCDGPGGALTGPSSSANHYVGPAPSRPPRWTVGMGDTIRPDGAGGGGADPLGHSLRLPQPQTVAVPRCCENSRSCASATGPPGLPVPGPVGASRGAGPLPVEPERRHKGQDEEAHAQP